MNSYQEIASLLIDLEAIMRSRGLWASEAPAAEAFASVEPFCVDTMALQEWLQFIFIPRMHSLIDAEAALPAKCEIKPVAEEALDNPGAELMAVIARLDEAITRA